MHERPGGGEYVLLFRWAHPHSLAHCVILSGVAPATQSKDLLPDPLRNLTWEILR